MQQTVIYIDALLACVGVVIAIYVIRKLRLEKTKDLIKARVFLEYDNVVNSWYLALLAMIVFAFALIFRVFGEAAVTPQTLWRIDGLLMLIFLVFMRLSCRSFFDLIR